MVTGTMHLTDPENVEVTASIIMTIHEWEELRDQLTSKYPSWRLSSIIGDLVRKARAVVAAEAELEP